MTITRSDCRYYIKEIKDLAKDFDDMGLPDHIDSKAFDSLSDKFFKNV